MDPFAFAGRSEDGWQVQNADRLKKRLKRTIIQELSKKDVMPDERAKMVRWIQKKKGKTPCSDRLILACQKDYGALY